MKLYDVWKNYAPNFVAGLMTAILISIILGYSPTRLELITLLFSVIGLYLAGLFFSWVLLWKFK